MVRIRRLVLFLATFVDVLSSSEEIAGCDPSDVHFVFTAFSVLVPPSDYAVINGSSVDGCAQVCREDPKCRTATLDYTHRSCHLSEVWTERSEQEELTKGYYGHLEKVCLPAARKCLNSWAFETVPSTKANAFPSERFVTKVSSKGECLEMCLRHSTLPCLSVEYSRGTGKCVLNAYNRFSSPAPVAQKGDAKNGVAYLENACLPEARGFCNTKTRAGRQIVTADKVLPSLSVEDCRKMCIKSPSFVCRAASFDQTALTCSLSHLPLTLLPDGGYVSSRSSVLTEVVVCYDVAVDCQPDRMAVHVRTSELFDGKVYARSRPKTCRQDIQRRQEFSLLLPLTETSCGTQRMDEGTFSNVLIIQANDHIVTFLDKAIGVQCSYGAGNITEDGNLRVWEEQTTDYKRKSPPIPDLSLRILDMQGNERNSVSLGEVLRVQVRMSNEDTYGIFLRNLVATDGTSEHNMTLIDNVGCPVYTRMMREVRAIGPESKGLESYLEAFAFTGSDVLELEAEVDTCVGSCRPVQCHVQTGRSDEDLETVTSFGRRKRRRASESDRTTVRLWKSVVVEATELTGDSLSYQAERLNSSAGIVSSVPGMDVLQGPPQSNSNSSIEFCLEGRKTSLFVGVLVSFNSLLFTFILVLWCRVSHCEDRERHLSVYYTNAILRSSESART